MTVLAGAAPHRVRNLVSLLPHRPPMLLLDHAEMKDDRVLEARQTIPERHPLLDGHFPGLPIWPGALLLEAMAQTTAVYLLNARRELEEDATEDAEEDVKEPEVPVFGAVTGRFLTPVFPGDAIRFETRLVRRMGAHGLFTVTARQEDGTVAARSEMTVGILPRARLWAEELK